MRLFRWASDRERLQRTPIQLARAIGAISSGGLLRRPHVAFPSDLPTNVIPASARRMRSGFRLIRIIGRSLLTRWRMSSIPAGQRRLSHLQGIDFAGKTGSAQTISNLLKAKMGAEGKSKFKDNGWFAGVEPRRNPEIVVCVLLEEGEHGYLAARTAAQVIKAYVEKQRRLPNKVAKNDGKVDIGALWSSPDAGGDASSDALHGGHFVLDVAKQHAAARDGGTRE